MNVLGAIVAGLAGTIIMTIMMYVAPMMGLPKMDMLHLLGSMITGHQASGSANKGLTLGLGAMIHLMMGIIFALIYALLWGLGIGSATWLWGLIFGAVHAIVAIVMLPLMMRFHPSAPEMERGPLAVLGQVMGHMVYGLVVALVYAAF